MAGLTAALAAAEAGGDVLVLESEPTVGGSMAISGGLIWGPALLRARTPVDPARRPRAAAHLRRRARGRLVMVRGPRPAARSAGGLPQGQMGRGRLMAVGGPGARGPWADTLLDAARREGAEVLVEARVDTVEPAEDGWTVTWTRAGSRTRARARSVIFSGGGFQNSAGPRAPLRQPVAGGHGRAQQPLERRDRAPQPAPAGAPVSHGMHSFYGHTLPYIEGKTWDDGLEFLAARCTSATSA